MASPLVIRLRGQGQGSGSSLEESHRHVSAPDRFIAAVPLLRPRQQASGQGGQSNSGPSDFMAASCVSGAVPYDLVLLGVPIPIPMREKGNRSGGGSAAWDEARLAASEAAWLLEGLARWEHEDEDEEEEGEAER